MRKASQTRRWALVMLGVVAASMIGCQAQSQTAAVQEAAPEAAPAPEAVTPAAAASACPTAMSELVLPSPDASPFLTEDAFVMHWQVLGPFQFAAEDFPNEQQEAAEHGFVPNEAALTGSEPAPEGTSWQDITFKGNVQPGQVDLDALYGQPDYMTAYAVACLDCPEAINDAILWTGSDDYIKVWINGELVQTYAEKRRGSDWDQDAAEGISLKQGCNRVVVKVVDVVGGYDFYFRLTDLDGLPITVKAE